METKSRLAGVVGILCCSIPMQSLAATHSSKFNLAKVKKEAMKKETIHRETASAEEPETESLSLKDILDVKVSVASLFEERDLDIAATVFSTNSTEWRRRGALRTFDAIRQAPGTMVYDVSLFSAGPTVALRGFNDPGQIPSISILWDGVTMSSIYQQSAILARPNIDLGVLDKIEMIVGPGSSLYGSDALQSVVAMITPDVTKENLSADVGGGMFGTYRGELKYAHEISPKLHVGLNLGITGQTDQATSASYQSLTYNQTLTSAVFTAVQSPVPVFATGANADTAFKENYLSTGAVAKVRYDKTEAGFYWTGYNAKGFPGAGYTARLTNPTLSPTPIFAQTTAAGNEYNQDSSLWMAKLSHDISLPASVDLTATGFYWKGSNTVFAGNTAGEVNLANAVNQKNEDWRTGLSFVARRKQDDTIPTRLAAGYSVDFTQISTATETIPNFPSAGTTYSANMAVNGKSRSINAVFIETDTAIIGRTLHLWADGREDIYNDFGGHFSPRLGLILQPDDNSAIKLLYGHAFRAPSSIELLGNPVGISGNATLSPDTQDTYQLQYMRREKAWNLSATAYTSVWNNQVVVVVPTGSFVPRYVNATDSSRAYGLELGGQYTLFSHLKLNAMGSYVRSFGSPADGGGNANYILFPTYIINWGLDYEVPSARLTVSLFNRHQITQGRYLNKEVLGQISPGLTTVGSITPSTMESFFRTDLGAVWDFGQNPGDWQLTANVRNLFNIRNYQAAISANFLGQIPEPGISGILGVRAKL